MAKSRYAIVHKAIVIVTTIVVSLYVFYSTLAVITDINLCCLSSVENKKNAYTAPCCDIDESCSGCCYIEIPSPNKTFIYGELLDRESYRNNIYGLHSYISDGFIFQKQYGIIYEERFILNDVIYFIFRPPKV